MPVMKSVFRLDPGATSGNQLAGLDFEFVRDSVITLWASENAPDTEIYCTFMAGTTALARDIRVNGRVGGLILDQDLLIDKELVEGQARLSLGFRSVVVSGTPDPGAIFWQVEVAPLGE